MPVGATTPPIHVRPVVRYGAWQEVGAKLCTTPRDPRLRTQHYAPYGGL
jgi:hypothetical protein